MDSIELTNHNTNITLNNSTTLIPSTDIDLNEFNETTEDDLTNSKFNNLNSQSDKKSTRSQNRIYNKIGNVHCFLFIDKINPLITIGPDYKYIIILTSIVISLHLVTQNIIMDKLIFYFSYIEYGLFYIFIISYLLTCLLNPGIWTQSSRDFNNSDFYKCGLCNFIISKNSKSGHCKFCNVCVASFDHHCMWSGKCIGKNNLATFFIMVVSTFLFFMFSVVSVMIYLTTFIDKRSVFKASN